LNQPRKETLSTTNYSVIRRKAQAKGKKNLSSRKKRDVKVETWLRKLVSDIDHGVLYTPSRGKPHPVHCNKNERVLEVLNKVPGRKWRHLEYLSNERLNRHFANIDTFYFAGNQRRDAKTLVMIDIDCHVTGTLKGAVAFAEWLRKHHYPNLYFETSTNGSGVHAYFVLDKMGMGASFINDLLIHRLEPWLDSLAQEHGFALEMVEVKGTMPVLSWGDRRGELTNYKSGVLAKLPREAKNRSAELMATTQIKATDLLRLPVVQPKAKSVSDIEDTATMSISPQVINKGSMSGKVIGDNQLAKLGQYRDLALQLMTSHKIQVNGKNRTVVTSEDMAIFLLVGEFFTENMNADGSLPWKRWARMWNSLERAGDVERGFDSHRLAAVRSYFDSLGLIDWASNKFVIGVKGRDGVRRGGKACKWKFSKVLMELLKTATEQQIAEDVGETGLEEADVSKVLEEGRGEAPLAVTPIKTAIETLVQKPWELVTRPQLDEKHYLWRRDPDELTAYITTFEPSLAA
jgi:hypothetical protein